MNVAAPFLLTGRLLDLCSDRILNVSSISMAESLDLGRLEQQVCMGGSWWTRFSEAG